MAPAGFCRMTLAVMLTRSEPTPANGQLARRDRGLAIGAVAALPHHLGRDRPRRRRVDSASGAHENPSRTSRALSVAALKIVTALHEVVRSSWPARGNTNPLTRTDAQRPKIDPPNRPGFVAKPPQYSQSGSAEELLMTRLITPMTRAQVYGLLIKTAPGTRRCSVGE